MVIRSGFNELRGDTNAVRRLTNTAFQRISYAQFPANRLHIDRTAFVREGRVTGDHEQRGVMRKSGDNVLRYPVGDELLLGVAAHVLERKHRD